MWILYPISELTTIILEYIKALPMMHTYAIPKFLLLSTLNLSYELVCNRGY